MEPSEATFNSEVRYAFCQKRPPLICKSFNFKGNTIIIEVIVDRGSQFPWIYEEHMDKLVRDLKNLLTSLEGSYSTFMMQMVRARHFRLRGEFMVSLRIRAMGNTMFEREIMKFCSEGYGWVGGETIVHLRIFILGVTRKEETIRQFCSDSAHTLAYEADLKCRRNKDRIHRYMY